MASNFNKVSQVGKGAVCGRCGEELQAPNAPCPCMLRDGFPVDSNIGSGPPGQRGIAAFATHVGLSMQTFYRLMTAAGFRLAPVAS